MIKSSPYGNMRYKRTQGTLTITEMGNSVPFSQKLDNLSEQPVTEIINKVLKNDAKKAFDTLAHAEFNKTPLKAYASGGTSTTAISLATASTVGGTSSKALAKGHVRAIVVAMKERNIPPYVQDDYYAISWPSTFSTLDADLEAIQVYTQPGFQMIMNGEKGRYANCRFIEQTNIAKAGTLYTDWCYFCGEDTVAEAIAVPEEMRGKIPSDFRKVVPW
jgi:N4-gp56 family major capsid protein